MKELKYIPSNCRFCGYQCGLIATVQGGRVLSVKPDPNRYPGDKKVMNGCRRWRQAVEVLDHPLRINYPLKRVGERGSGKWEKISWDEALDEIAAKLSDLKDRYGPETLATSIGAPHTTYWPLHRFLALFGSPNNMGIGQNCWNPGIFANTLTFGWPLEMELVPGLTSCALLWGVNPAESDNSLLWQTIRNFTREGNPLIVVDPRRTRTARRATLWLPVKPGTDAYLALGLLHVIITNKWYDQEFVETWCHGFAKLSEHVRPYEPDKVEALTGVNAEKIVKAARLFAQNSPATLLSGRGIDQLGPNTFPTHHALAILRAITGNVDKLGASHICEMPDFIPELDLELSEQFVHVYREKQLGKDRLLLQSYKGYERLRELTIKHGKRLPMRYLTSAHPNLVWRAMLTGKPYPIRAMIVMASNPLLTQADSRLIYKALKSLDLLVVLEQFPTPTAMLADYVLPSAGVLERPLLETKAGTANIAYGGQAAVQPYYERRPDYDFWRGLGLRLGQEKYWPWETYLESLQASLAPTGVSWEEFCRFGIYDMPSGYYKHEEVDLTSGLPRGFSTKSGKVELYNEFLAELGYPPLPEPQGLPQPDILPQEGLKPAGQSQPAETKEAYPFQLISGARIQPYYASNYHQIEKFRASHPEPRVEISPATAESLGLEEGTWVWVETERGRARFQVKLTQMRDDVVSVEYGWWDPEMTAADPDLGGLWLSNANILTNADFETADPLVGTWTYNGIPCRIVKV